MTKALFVLFAAGAFFAGRKTVATREALAAVTIGFLALEWACALWCFWRLRRRERPLPDSLPPLFVLVPVAGAFPRLEANAKAFLAQRYPGSLRVVFVVPTGDDPARSVLERTGAEVWISGRRSKRAAGKLTDMAYALERVPEDREYVLFSEGDACVPETFAARLAEAMGDEKTVLASGAGVPSDGQNSFWGRLSLAWVAGGFPGLTVRAVPWGGACIARRRDLIAANVAARWRRAISDDGILAQTLGASGRVSFVPEAVVCVEPHRVGASFFDQLHRWFVSARVYAPRLWLLGGLAVFGKTVLFISLIFPRPLYGWAAGLILADAAYFAFVAATISARAGGSAWAGLGAGCVSPLLWGVYGIQFLRSAVDDVVVWGARRYRVRGPEDVAEVA